MDEEAQTRQRSSEGVIVDFCETRYGSNLESGEYAFSFEDSSGEKRYWLTYKEVNEDTFLYVTDTAPELDMTNYLNYVWEYNKENNRMYLKNVGAGKYLQMKDELNSYSPMILVDYENKKHLVYLNNGIKIINQQYPTLYANLTDIDTEEKHLIKNYVYGDSSLKGTVYNIVRAYKVDGGRLPWYTGEYEIYSKCDTDQTLSTKLKSMNQDLKIVKNHCEESVTPHTTGKTYTIY